MGTRLYVGNLSYNVTEPELREVFAEGGRNVVEVKIVMDRDTGRPRGFAFVEMGSDDEASQAIQSLTGREVQGRAINVSEARERTPRGGGGYGGGGGGGGGYGGGGRGGGGYGEGGGRGGYGEGGGRGGRGGGRRGGW
jgi:RNA recognition motif-containing protein